jgi:hypothetical protein
MTGRDEHREVADVAKETIDVEEDGRHAVASIPGLSGHREPGRQSGVVDEVLDDPRIQHGEHVTVSVPMGDTEALDRVRERLDVTSTRAAGSTVIVEADGHPHAPEHPSR